MTLRRPDGRALRVDVERTPGVPPDEIARVRALFDALDLWHALPDAPRIRVRTEALLDEGLTLAQAHAVWNEEYVLLLPSLPGHRKQPPDARTPKGIVRVACECIRSPSGGMTSYFGFAGHYASVLVDLDAGIIWDARVDKVH